MVIKGKHVFEWLTGKPVERQNCHLYTLCIMLFTQRRKVRLEQARHTEAKKKKILTKTLACLGKWMFSNRKN